MAKDLFDRLSLEKKQDLFDRIPYADLFSRIKVDLFDKIEIEFSDLLQKKLELSPEIKKFIQNYIEKLSSTLEVKIPKPPQVEDILKSVYEELDNRLESYKEVEPKLQGQVSQLKGELDEFKEKLKERYDELKTGILNQPRYEFGGYALTVTEEDGSPSGIPTKIKFSNGTVTNNGDGSFSVSTGGSGAPADATYITLSTNATLTNERVLTGTSNQVVVTDNGAGSTAVLSTPQNIDAAATPTFAGLTLSTTPLGIASGGTGQITAVAAFNALDPLTTLGDTLYNDGTDSVRLAGNITSTKKFLRQTGNGAVSAAPAWDTVVDADLPATVVRTSRLITSGSGLTGGGDLSADRTLVVGAGTGITVNADDVALTIPVAVTSGGTGQTSYTNGQLLIGNTTGNTLAKATITGTTNQVVVTNGASSITLSTPQDIATTSSPTFAGLLLAIANKTTTYSITSSDYFITADATSAAFTITLPTAVGKTGQMFCVKKTDASNNAVTIGTTSSQTIDGATTYLLRTKYEMVRVISDNANWHLC